MFASWRTRIPVAVAAAIAVSLVGPPSAMAKPGGGGGGPPKPPPASLVVNGTFDAGTTGWTVTPRDAQVQVVTSAPTLDPGTGRFLLVTGGRGTTVSQTVPVVAGQSYRIGWSSTGGDEAGTWTMGAGPLIVWPHTVVQFSQIINDSCPTTHWYAYSQPVRAAGSTLTVTFGFTGTVAWGLDEVSVTPTR